MQFHLEADTDYIERWLVGHAHELGQAEVNLRTLHMQAYAAHDRLEAAFSAVFSAWLDRIES